MSNGNNALIDIGYNKDNKVVMVVHGKMEEEGKNFDAVTLLTDIQASKLSEDLRTAVIMMKAEKEKA